MKEGVPFGVVSRLLAAFPSSSGFEPTSFTAWAYPPSTLRGAEPHDEIQRSFRFELDGCCAHLRVHGDPRSRWRRDVVRQLLAAGYERWLADDESVDLRRWLRGERQRLAELGFLRELGAVGERACWPTRAPTSRPAPVPFARWARADWARVIREVRAAGIPWDNAGISISRSAVYPARVSARGLRISVGLVGWDDTVDGKRLLVWASVADATDGRDQEVLLPPRLVRDLRRVLHHAGFEADRVRSSRNGKLRTGRVNFSKDMATEIAAAQELPRVLEALKKVGSALGPS
jgi:hypothetical protein